MADLLTDIKQIVTEGLADAGLGAKEIKAVEGAGLPTRIVDYIGEREQALERGRGGKEGAPDPPPVPALVKQVAALYRQFKLEADELGLAPVGLVVDQQSECRGDREYPAAPIAPLLVCPPSLGSVADQETIYTRLLKMIAERVGPIDET